MHDFGSGYSLSNRLSAACAFSGSSLSGFTSINPNTLAETYNCYKTNFARDSYNR